MDKSELLSQIQNLKSKYGDWSYDIPLPFEVWTRGNLKIPHTRLKRIVQIVSDLVDKPLNECRILDLGCLDGMFSIEFAQHGAETIGIEVRESNIKKAIFCKEILKLGNLEFRHEDARNITIESHGMFDVIICSGLLYHLTASEAIELISKMFNMSRKLVVIDTHIALESKDSFFKEPNTYWGHYYQEHNKNDTQEKKAKRIWASWDNNESYWFTRPSLINILKDTGFTSVYECFSPTHLNFGKPGIEHINRCTFVAVKGEQLKLFTSPTANNLNENWPEDSLKYGATIIKVVKPFHKRLISKLKRMLK